MSAPGYSLRSDYLLWTLLGALLVFSTLVPHAIASYPKLVDWPTIATLAGLLVLTAGIEASGFLHQAAWRVLAHLHDQRSLALVLVTGSWLLSGLLTNDIALFIVVPLTLTLADMAALPLRRLIIFEALAVNAGSMLTPIGNPQNIFLWQSSGAHFQEFMAAMTVPTLIASLCLLAFTLVAFRPRPVVIHAATGVVAVNWPLLTMSALLFVPFIVAADLHHADLALLVIGVLYAVSFRPVFRRIDWPLLLVFVLMFVDLRVLAGMPWVSTVLGMFDLDHPRALYGTGVVVSQLISNVPATILLSSYSHDWRTLAWAADMGGFGLLVGSLANLIALRLGGQRGSLWAFHAWSVPFLVLAGGLTYIWLLMHAGG